MARRKARKSAADRPANGPSAFSQAGEPRDREAISERDARLAIYDGTDQVGSIVERGGTFDAYDSSDQLIGSFTALRAAVRAIPRAQP